MRKSNFVLAVLFVFCFVLLPVSALALNVELTVPEVVYPGEEIAFNYRIDRFAWEREEVVYVSSINCESYPLAPLEQKTAVFVNNKLSERFVLGKVDANTNEQSCTATVQIMYPFEMTFKKNFMISSPPEVDADILLMNSRGVETNKFLVGELISFGIVSESRNIDEAPKDVVDVSFLTLPDGSSQKVDLPFKLGLTQVGSYRLTSKFSLLGHREKSVVREFAVIQTQVSISENPLLIEKRESSADVVKYNLILQQAELYQSEGFFMNLKKKVAYKR